MQNIFCEEILLSTFGVESPGNSYTAYTTSGGIGDQSSE